MTAATHSEGKHLGPAQYVMVWAALMVLTGVTLAVWKTDFSYAARVVIALAVRYGGLSVAENAGVLPQPDYAVTITQWM